VTKPTILNPAPTTVLVYGYALRALEQEVARLGLTGIALHVFGHNTQAQSLYRKLGYETTNINLFKPIRREYRDDTGSG